jgi:hypothetical protein
MPREQKRTPGGRRRPSGGSYGRAEALRMRRPMGPVVAELSEVIPKKQACAFANGRAAALVSRREFRATGCRYRYKILRY